MRLIDADMVKEVIRKNEEGLSLDIVEGLKTAIAIIDVAPTIEPKQEWIPCEERLPKRQGYYICTCKDGSKNKRTTTIKWSNGWQQSGARAYWKVIAWMPLPEPYQPKERSE